MFNYIFNFDKVNNTKKHYNTLYFTRTCSVSNGVEFKISYTGVDVRVENGVNIPEKVLKELNKFLKYHYGYAPFDKKEIKLILKENNCFSMWF